MKDIRARLLILARMTFGMGAAQAVRAPRKLRRTLIIQAGNTRRQPNSPPLQIDWIPL